MKTLCTVVKGKRGRVFFSPLGGPSCQVGFGSRNPSQAQRGSDIAGRTQELLTQASLYQKILLLALYSSPGQGFSFFLCHCFMFLSLLFPSFYILITHSFFLSFFKEETEFSSFLTQAAGTVNLPVCTVLMASLNSGMLLF